MSFGRDDDQSEFACYDDLQPWAANLCEKAYQDSLAKGRRRRAARMDFVPGWKEAARQLGRPDVFLDAGVNTVSGWRPREADLTTYMQGQIEKAYQQRERPRCSRDDFADGFMAALVLLRSKSSFQEGRFEPKSDS